MTMASSLPAETLSIPTMQASEQHPGAVPCLSRPVGLAFSPRATCAADRSSGLRLLSERDRPESTPTSENQAWRASTRGRRPHRIVQLRQESSGGPAQLRRIVRVSEIGGVSEDQSPIIELYCPLTARFGNSRISYDHADTGGTTKVFHDDTQTLVTAARIHPHTVTYRELNFPCHGANLRYSSPTHVQPVESLSTVVFE